MLTLLALIITLGVLVFVHELGHFLAAKWAGIHVHRFALGLGKPIPWLSFTRGVTEYAVCWVPLGGYVKMATREEDATSSALEGETPLAPVAEDAYYEAKPVWKRMIVILAGVTMNFLFAWAVFGGMAWVNGVTVLPVTRVGHVVPDSLPAAAQPLLTLEPGSRIVAVNGEPVGHWQGLLSAIGGAPGDSLVLEVEGRAPLVLPIHQDDLGTRIRAALALEPWVPAVVGGVTAGDPADRGGIQPGDTLVAVGGAPVGQWVEAVDGIEASPGVPLAVTVGREGGRVDLTVTPRAVEEPAAAGSRTVGRIGIGLRQEVSHEPVGFLRAMAVGLELTGEASTQIVRTIRGMFTGRVSTRELGGPILIGEMAGQAAQAGGSAFLAFMALISVNLAVLNLLPIPILDGGQFLFLLAEGVLRRPLSLKVRESLATVGLVLIGLLFVLVFWNDLSRLFGRLVG